MRSLETVVEILEEWEDLVLVQMPGGQRAALYLVDRPLDQDEIIATLRENTAAGIHTLYILWAIKLLPDHGQVYQLTDWLEQLQKLYGGILAYFVYGEIVDIAPVYFDDGRVRYGTIVDPARLRLFQDERWLLADFGGQVAPPPLEAVEVNEWHMILGVAGDADRSAIRDAYRQLVKQYHPDVNDAPDATLRMQLINEAYFHLMQQNDD